MTPARFIGASLLHYRFSYAGVLAGAVLGATVLLGALFAGDSVEESLRRIARLRTGRATHIAMAGDRFFREALAGDLSAGGTRAAPVLYARGTASSANTGSVANQVQLIGVTDAFWRFAPTPAAMALDAKAPTVAINATLAQRLGVFPGDTVIVRLQKPGILASDAPIAGADARIQSLRCTVEAVVLDEAFGRFTVETTQLPPASVFLPIAVLQDALRQPGRANLLLLDSATGRAPADALAQAVQLADYGLSLRWLESAGMFELTSSRIFLDPEIVAAVIAALPKSQPVVSYLVNELAHAGRTAPYSIATATTHPAAPFLPADLRRNEIVLNDWLADDLQAGVGDEVGIKYYRAGPGGALVEDRRAFRVRSIVPLAGLAADRAWMPDFPGMSEAKRQGDWDSGLPLDLDRIRDKDERYWDKYRGAPKAFIALEAGHEIWSTRWGNNTALRIPFERGAEAELARTILGALRPEMNQLQVREFGAKAGDSARSPVDFGGLFVGMSFFLIAAALGLVAMLFQFSLLQRNREDALLGAVGLSARTLLRWRLAESALILLPAAAVGVAAATFYTRGILRFLETIWAGQGAGPTFVFAAEPASIAAGALVFLLLSLIAIWLAIRKQMRRALSIRLAANVEQTESSARIRRTSQMIAVAAVIVAVVAVALSRRVMPAQAAFYLAGFALLAAGIAACRWWLAQPVEDAAMQLTPARLGGSNLKARRSRSLTVVGLIATAVFMVLSVASFRKHVGSDWLERASGTGGFAFWVETTVPLNPARDGRSGKIEPFDSLGRELGDIVPLRTGAGDNANCFNLNAIAQPRLLAVDPARLEARNAFRLQVAPRTMHRAGWNILRWPGGDAPVPAVVDATTLQWALKRKAGDVIRYVDENGRSFDVQIAGTIPDSVFQGYLIVDEAALLAKFPSNPGYSVFLIDAPAATDFPALRRRLATATRDVGGRVDLTRDVLAAFHEIENTYISIFNVLGSLGVILGSLGLAIVVARNLHERRGEFGVMTAMGIPRGVLARIVFAEFGRLVGWGMAVGIVAALIAVWPNLTHLPPAPTVLLVSALLAGIVLLNLASGWVVFGWAMRAWRPSLQQVAL